MYSIEWSKVLPRESRGGAVTKGDTSGTEGGRATQRGTQHLPKVHPTVWALGFTSLLTDVSSEMISSILPMYLVLHLGMSPLMFGVVDGIYQGAAVLVRVLSGILADRWQRHKELATVGYGISALCRVLLLSVGHAWGAIAAVIALDRVGKGIRTAPRDALIARRSKAPELSTAFGVHRTLDAA
ncbi:MAG: MFS transporter, partial [Verrucomicrobiaceae bacterium]